MKPLQLPPPRPSRKQPLTPPTNKVHDKLGAIIPPNLHDVWARRETVADAAKALKSIRTAIKKAESEKDGAWSGINFANTLGHIENAIAQVDGAVPHCVCLFCHGIGCNACKGVGMMTAFQYKNAPEDMKK